MDLNNENWNKAIYNIHCDIQRCGESRLILLLHEININQMHLLSLSSNIEILYKRDSRLEEH